MCGIDGAIALNKEKKINWESDIELAKHVRICLRCKGIKHLHGDKKELASLQRELGKVKIESSQINSLIF